MIFGFRSASRWSFGVQKRHKVLIFPVPCRVDSIWAPWSSRVDVFHPQVFCCVFCSSLTPRFLQRRAPLPVIEMEKSPWNVSDVERRETGLFPGIARDWFLDMLD